VSAYQPGGMASGDLGSELEAAGLRPYEPGVSELLSALAAPPSGGELGGEQAALAMFRANPWALPSRQPSQSPGQRSQGWRPRGLQSQGRRSQGWRLRIGLAAAAATTVVGTVAAAYAAALPAPVQHLAYQVLGFAGVPDSGDAGPGNGHQHPQPGGSASVPANGSGGRSAAPSPSPSGPSHRSSGPSSPASPHPSRSRGAPVPPGAQLSISASQHQIPAGGTAVLTVWLSQGGHAVPGVSVRLLERVAGQVSWRTAGTTRTPASGSATVRVSGLAVNAYFRFAADGRISRAVSVTVVPAVTLKALANPDPHRRTALLAASPGARAGDVVVLQVQVNGTWRDVRARRLGGDKQRTFLVTTRLFAGRAMRAELLPTRTHAGSVSNTVTLPSG